jgi:hypothetical protein
MEFACVVRYTNLGAIIVPLGVVFFMLISSFEVFDSTLLIKLFLAGLTCPLWMEGNLLKRN